jgi:hypothetical protein
MHFATRKQDSTFRLTCGLQMSVDMVLLVQNMFQPFDGFLSFVSSATNPSSVLHYLVPVSNGFLYLPQMQEVHEA